MNKRKKVELINAYQHKELITEYTGLALQGHCAKYGVPDNLFEQMRCAEDCVQMAHVLALKINRHCKVN